MTEYSEYIYEWLPVNNNEPFLPGPANTNRIATAGTIFFSSKAEGVPCSHSTQATDNAVGGKNSPSPSGCA